MTDRNRLILSAENSPAIGHRRLRRAGGISAELVTMPALKFNFRVESSGAYLALHDILRTDGETSIDGFVRSTEQNLRNKLTFVPQRSKVQGWSNLSGQVSSVLGVHLSPAPEDLWEAGLSDLPPALYFENDALRETMLKIQRVVSGSSIDERSYLETLGCVIVHELRHALQQGKGQVGQLKGGLTPRQLSRIEDYVDAKISEELSLADLAQIVGLSRFHFIRAFKKSTGIAPYQFVIAKRVAHAKKLLSQRQMRISEVAAAAGFNSALQLNRAFKKMVHVAPSVFRQQDGAIYPSIIRDMTDCGSAEQ